MKGGLLPRAREKSGLKQEIGTRISDPRGYAIGQVTNQIGARRDQAGIVKCHRARLSTFFRFARYANYELVFLGGLPSAGMGQPAHSSWRRSAWEKFDHEEAHAKARHPLRVRTERGGTSARFGSILGRSSPFAKRIT